MLRKDQLKTLTGATGTADPDEIQRFEKLADEWWKPRGAFKMVHRFNAARVAYLSDVLPRHFQRDPARPSALRDLTLVDVGCGAGLVSEPMSALGADVLGIDATERNIAIASRHAAASGAAIRYRHALPETLVQEGGQFDIVLTLEVVEHVADVQAFLTACAGLVAPGGILVIGTLNRTPKSYALAIVGAEYVLGWLPRGTHEWGKFVKPRELEDGLEPHGLAYASCQGVAYNPISDRWRMSGDTSVNYLSTFVRPPKTRDGQRRS